MVKSFDHVTIVVRDVEAAKRFFGLLGFREVQSVLISGHEMDEYMGVPGIEAEHVTLELTGSSPRNEVQLLRYRHPEPRPDPGNPRPDQALLQSRLLRLGRRQVGACAAKACKTSSASETRHSWPSASSIGW